MGGQGAAGGKDATWRLEMDARREPFALEGWFLEIFCCDPKGSRAFLRILSTEGRGVRLCCGLNHSNIQTLNDLKPLQC